jgi:hypothetical protein
VNVDDSIPYAKLFEELTDTPHVLALTAVALSAPDPATRILAVLLLGVGALLKWMRDAF